MYKGLAAAPKGVFATTYYFRDADCADCKDFKGQDAPWTKTDIYKTGLLQYLAVTERPEFAGWKVVIYLDALSLEHPTFRSTQSAERTNKHQEQWAKIAAHPNVVFAVVDWPEYAVGSKGDGKTIDNAILRALRFKAFVDFPDTPVFIRDADTLFENIIKVRSIVDELAAWELTLWQAIKKIFAGGPYQILIASQPNYHRQWHVHPQTGVNTTGCYAAVTSSLGGIPEWADGSLWRKCLEYLRANTRVVAGPDGERKPDNISKPTYIGKDEQLLSYVVIQEILEKVYFYYLEYIQVEGCPIVDTSGTPFARDLLAAGYKRYPSPYRVSLGEPMPDGQEKRKDENQKTEGTILSLRYTPLALGKDTHDVLQRIFKFYRAAIAAARAAPGFVPKQLGGGSAAERGRGGSAAERGRGGSAAERGRGGSGAERGKAAALKPQVKAVRRRNTRRKKRPGLTKRLQRRRVAHQRR
jgi:hypothetical protein